MRYDSDYCFKKAEEIGVNVLAVVKNMLNEEVIRNLRSAQNIIRMSNKYGKERLEKACERTVFFNNYSYFSIKRILEQALDKQHYMFLEEPKIKLSVNYARNIKELLIQETTIYGNNSAS